MTKHQKERLIESAERKLESLLALEKRVEIHTRNSDKLTLRKKLLHEAQGCMIWLIEDLVND